MNIIGFLLHVLLLGNKLAWREGGGLPPPLDWGTARSALSDGGPGQLWGAVARRPLVPPMENAPRQTECDPTGRARRGTAR